MLWKEGVLMGQLWRSSHGWDDVGVDTCCARTVRRKSGGETAGSFGADGAC